MRHALLASTAIALFACSSGVEQRIENAHTIAESGRLQPHTIRTPDFTLQSFERRHGGRMVRVYIEGDGFAWETRYQPSQDPTPRDPVALKLAAADPEPDVVYLARPCQFVRDERCDTRYWTSARYAPEVIRAVRGAIAALPYEQVELVGFSGGGALALWVAADDRRVRSIRSVAANLDTDAFTEFHALTPLRDSPSSRAAILRTATLPQLHYVGQDDDIIPPTLTRRYIESLPPHHCAHMASIPGYGHHSAWEKQWGQWLDQPLPPCVAK